MAKKYYKEKAQRESEKEIKLTDIGVGCMDAQHLRFPDNSFDVVLLFEALYYLEDPVKFVSEAERVLRQRGVLNICTVNKIGRISTHLRLHLSISQSLS